tara:strand:+ start:68 stop:730 length:663 start_codon:yes stop_codon:yes gene_type:complete
MSYQYNYNNPMNRVCDYTEALQNLGDSIVEGTKYPNLAAIKAKYDSTSDKHGKAHRYSEVAKILPDVSISGFYGTRYARNGKRKWTPEEEQFLVRAVCSSVDPYSVRGHDMTMSKVLLHVGMIMGRTPGACQLKASDLGITKQTSQYATITTKCGRVLSTKTGLPVEESKPKRVSIKTKAKKNRTPKSVSGKSVINLGKGVRNVSISYTEQGEMQITFEG